METTLQIKVRKSSMHRIPITLNIYAIYTRAKARAIWTKLYLGIKKNKKNLVYFHFFL